MFMSASYNQTVTYWAPTGGDDGFGKKTLAAPIAISARWEDRQEQFLDAKGMQSVSKAHVRVKDSQSIQIDGFLYLGSSVATDPRTVDGAFQIMQLTRVPDLRNLEAEKVAIL